MKILIADDEMISRAAVKRMIRNYCPWAGPIEEASNGREAVERAKMCIRDRIRRAAIMC